MPNKRKITFNDFRGGLNVDVAPDHLAPNELATAINIDYSERGSTKKRNGTSKVNSVSYNAKTTQIFDWHRADGSIQLMAVIGDFLCEVSENGELQQVVKIAGNKISYFFLQDKMYFVDGEKYRFYDGMGVTEITTKRITLRGIKISASGLKPGTYKVAITFMSTSGQETIASPVEEVTITEPDNAIVIENMPEPLQNTASRLIYVAGEGISENQPNRFFNVDVEKIIDRTITRYMIKNNYVASNTKLNVSSLPFEMLSTPKCKYIVRHSKSNRIFMAGDPLNRSALYFSEPNNPSIIKPTSIMYPTNDDGPITGLTTFVDAVVVFFNNSIWVWRGFDPEIDAIWQRIPIPIGTVSPYSIRQITQLLTYVGSGGIYGISPVAIGQSADINPGESYIVNITNNKVSNIIKNITNVDQVVAAYDSRTNKYLLAYSDDETQENNKILIMDESLRAFAIWEGIKANDIFCRSNGDVLIATDNYILKFDDSYSDIDVLTGNTKPIKMEVEVKSSFETPMIRKLYTRVWTQVGGETSVNYQLVIEADNENVLNETINVNEENEIAVSSSRFRALGKQLSTKIIHDTKDKGLRFYGFEVACTPVRTYSKRV